MWIVGALFFDLEKTFIACDVDAFDNNTTHDTYTRTNTNSSDDVAVENDVAVAVDVDVDVDNDGVTIAS